MCVILARDTRNKSGYTEQDRTPSSAAVAVCADESLFQGPHEKKTVRATIFKLRTFLPAEKLHEDVYAV